MNISALFIRRPVATTLLAVAILISGSLAYFRLPVAPLPNITYPVVVVQASMAGASPDIMASTVAEPLEKRLAAIADVNEMTSTSTVGSARIVVQFGLNRDINGAARDVQAAIQAARADLPSTLRNNPSYREYNPADSPIMVLALTSDTLTRAQLYDSANSVIQQQLSQVDGVGQITLGGSALPSVRVELEPDKLNSYGIGLEDVRAAISAANANSAKGHIDQDGLRYEVTSNDQIKKAAPYRDLVIAYRNGSPVQLRDVADVEDSAENIRNMGLYNGKPAVLVIVYPIPGSNIVKTVAQIRKVLPSVEATLPSSIKVGVAIDRSVSVNAAVGDTERSLFIAVLLVIGVVFVFLQSPRATLIPSVALPLSIVGTFGPMYLLGYSIDNLSLMALTIGTGFVVDDAVVVLENIVRHVEEGMDVREAALKGSGEVGFTVISMSLSLIAVFRHHRPAVPRVRGDAVDRHPAVDGDLADGDAHHGGLPAASRCSDAFQGTLGGVVRKAVRALQARLLALADRGARSCLAGGPHLDRPARAQRVPVQAAAVDVLSGTGQRHPDGPDHCRPEYFLPSDGKETGAIAVDRAERSRRRLGGRLHRRPRAEYREPVRGAEAAGRTQAFRRAGGRSPAPEAQCDLRREAVPAGGAGLAHRRPSVRFRVPVHVDQR